MPTPNDFSNYQFPENRNTAGGEFTQTASAPPAEVVPAGTYPNVQGYGYDPSNREFSSDVDGDPRALANRTAESMNAFAELQTFFNNKLETPGSRIAHDRTKPWTPPSGAEGE